MKPHVLSTEAGTNATTAPRAIDLVIAPRWLIPIEPAGVVLEDYALAVDAGRILAVLPSAEMRARFAPREHLLLADHALLPGLVNLHTHAAMSLLRGYADDLALMAWLKERIWPAEARLVSKQFVREGSLLACAEMLASGVTCINDMYFFPQEAGEAALQLGMRAAIGLTVLDFPTNYAADAQSALEQGLAARDSLRAEANSELLSFCLAPHAPYSVGNRTFEKVRTLAAELDVPIHIHLHETHDEIEESLQRYGLRPLARLAELGLLGPQFIAAHGVHLTAGEIDLLAQHSCHLAHCPTANMKLASGIAPLTALLNAGVNVGLGTDGAASCGRLDLFQEMRQAALLAKVASGDATAAPAHQVLRMATLGGAQALGLDAHIGSLVAGKSADLTAVRLADWRIAPCFDAAAHLVYVAGGNQVSHTWTAGQLRYAAGAVVGLDTVDLSDKIAGWRAQAATSL